MRIQRAFHYVSVWLQSVLFVIIFLVCIRKTHWMMQQTRQTIELIESNSFIYHFGGIKFVLESLNLWPQEFKKIWYFNKSSMKLSTLRYLCLFCTYFMKFLYFTCSLVYCWVNVDYSFPFPFTDTSAKFHLFLLILSMQYSINGRRKTLWQLWV